MDVRLEPFYTTTPITVETDDGEAFGTGFFFHFCEKHLGIPAPALVTNKHVVAGATAIRFPLNVKTGSEAASPGEFVLVHATINDCTIVDHPDATVDLCAVLLGPFMGEVTKRTQRTTGLICMTPEHIASMDELNALMPLDSIAMIGYPIGLWDDHNNQPLARRGVLSTQPSLDFQGRPEFMIDMACFPGSSGSPVMIIDVGHYTDRAGNLVMRSRRHLLGILYAGPVLDADGTFHPAPIPTAFHSVTVEVPIHLGYVIRATELLTLEKAILPSLVDHATKQINPS